MHTHVLEGYYDICRTCCVFHVRYERAYHTVHACCLEGRSSTVLVPTGCPNYDTRTLIKEQAANWLIYPHFRNRTLLHIDTIDTQQRGEIGARIQTYWLRRGIVQYCYFIFRFCVIIRAPCCWYLYILFCIAARSLFHLDDSCRH